MFDFIVDLVTLPVKIATVVFDEATGTELTEGLEAIKDEIKIGD